MKEMEIQNAIRLALNPYAVTFDTSIGSVINRNGVFIRTGLPKGYPDISGYRKSDGKAVFIEVKKPKGSKVYKEQKHFLKVAKSYGAICGIARSPEEAIKIVKGE